MTLQHLSVGEIAVILPDATAVFRRHKIDFGCKGDTSLAYEAESRGLDLSAIEAELHGLDSSAEPAPSETADLISPHHRALSQGAPA